MAVGLGVAGNGSMAKGGGVVTETVDGAGLGFGLGAVNSNTAIASAALITSASAMIAQGVLARRDDATLNERKRGFGKRLMARR